MKSFKQYLTESKKEYKFRIKYAGTLTDSQLDRIELALGKYSVIDMSKPKVTPIQEHPMDFQTLKNSEVSLIDVTVNYPSTPEIIRNELQEYAALHGSYLLVMNADHPEEIAREEDAKLPDDQEYKPLLDSEYEDKKQDATFGDEYNANMLKELERGTPDIEIAKKEKQG
tara:strand:- start:7392 stop:7901 length:510 start_codon:yes stop_codon:yes gene_type:complete